MLWIFRGSQPAFPSLISPSAPFSVGGIKRREWRKVRDDRRLSRYQNREKYGDDVNCNP